MNSPRRRGRIVSSCERGSPPTICWVRYTEKPGAGSDAEGSFAAVEDQRNDEALFVAEMPIELAEERVAGVGIGVGGTADQREIARARAEQGVRRRDDAANRLMNVFVVVLEHLEAAHQLRLGRAEQR